MKLTDQELLKELELRFNQRNKMIGEQKQFLADLEKVNKKLVDSERLKSDFLSNIKNEINNPITSMLGLLKMMISQPDAHEKNESMTKLIYNETYILNFHLQNIFFAAEIEAGQFMPDMSIVNVNKEIKNAAKALSEVYRKKNITIEFNLQESDEFVTDRNKLEIVISNLISNAIKFSHDGGKVVIDTQIDENNLLVNFQDFGIGLAEKDFDRVFDRFKQLDTGTTKEYGGHGLGLSVVQSILEIMDGDIGLESEDGKGSIFTIRLPQGKAVEDDNLFDVEDEFLFEGGDETEQVF